MRYFINISHFVYNTYLFWSFRAISVFERRTSARSCAALAQHTRLGDVVEHFEPNALTSDSDLSIAQAIVVVRQSQIERIK